MRIGTRKIVAIREEGLMWIKGMKSRGGSDIRVKREAVTGEDLDLEMTIGAIKSINQGNTADAQRKGDSHRAVKVLTHLRSCRTDSFRRKKAIIINS